MKWKRKNDTFLSCCERITSCSDLFSEAEEIIRSFSDAVIYTFFIIQNLEPRWARLQTFLESMLVAFRLKRLVRIIQVFKVMTFLESYVIHKSYFNLFKLKYFITIIIHLSSKLIIKTKMHISYIYLQASSDPSIGCDINFSCGGEWIHSQGYHLWELSRAK